MKVCPQCRRTYDDSLSFCLEDGALLSSPAKQTEPDTLLLGQTPAAGEEKKFNFWKAAFISLILLFGGAAAAAIIYFGVIKDNQKPPANSNTNKNSSNVNSVVKPSPSATVTPSPSPTADANSEINANANTAEPTASPTKTPEKTTPESAVKNLKQGMSYAAARKMLLSGGWQAVRFSPNRELGGQEEYVVNELGYYEMDACSGTGVGYCRFLFQNVDKRRLAVVTYNNEEGVSGGPRVDNWSYEK